MKTNIEDAVYVLARPIYSSEYGRSVVIKSSDPKATGKLIIPSMIGGLPVTRIDYLAYSGVPSVQRSDDYW